MPVSEWLVWVGGIGGGAILLTLISDRIRSIVSMPEKLDQHIEETAHWNRGLVVTLKTGVQFMADSHEARGGEITPEVKRKIKELDKWA